MSRFFSLAGIILLIIGVFAPIIGGGSLAVNKEYAIIPEMLEWLSYAKLGVVLISIPELYFIIVGPAVLAIFNIYTLFANKMHLLSAVLQAVYFAGLFVVVSSYDNTLGLKENLMWWGVYFFLFASVANIIAAIIKRTTSSKRKTV